MVSTIYYHCIHLDERILCLKYRFTLLSYIVIGELEHSAQHLQVQFTIIQGEIAYTERVVKW